MRTATKFVGPLTDVQRQRLKEIHKTDPNWRTRMRAQAILLSEKGLALNQLATIFEIDRDSVSQWLDSLGGIRVRWALGWPPQRAPANPGRRGEKNEALKVALENPRSLKAGALRIASRLGQQLSPWTLKRLLKRRG